MASAKITDLDPLSTPDIADLVVVVDVSDTTMAASGTNKKSTVAGITANTLHLTGTETAAGAKTFTDNVVIKGSSGNTNGTAVLSILSRLSDDRPCVIIGDNGPSYFTEIRLGTSDSSAGHQLNGFLIAPGSIQGAGGFRVGWTSDSTTYAASVDVGLGRSAAGVASVDDGDQTTNVGLRFRRKSSTTAKQDAGGLFSDSIVNTHASRTYRTRIATSGYGGDHDAMYFDDTGSIAMPVIPLANVRDAADDSAAAALSPAVPVGGIYRTGSALKIRTA